MNTSLNTCRIAVITHSDIWHTTHQPTIISRAEHNISRKDISKLGVQVLYRLKDAGFEAHLVGGGVRDLLLGLHPKDFDVATNATPEEVRRLFHNSRIIGRRFQIVHVFSGYQVVEVTTFRKGAQEESDETQHGLNEHGIVLRDNIFGNIEEDAVRRDFTVNALYYNIADFSITDFVNGMGDLKQRKMRMIGDPIVRFREDPVRMLRAVRLASKLGFHLDQAIVDALPHMRSLLKHVSRSRMFDEFIKILMSGKSYPSFESLLQHGLLDELFPSIPLLWAENPEAEALAKKALINTDKRIQEDKSINPSFMLAILYWPHVVKYYRELLVSLKSKTLAFDEAINQAVLISINDLSIPRRFTTQMREIWLLQRRFNAGGSKRLLGIPMLPRFRAAYDFLILRSELSPDLVPLLDWWTHFYETQPEERNVLLKGKVILAHPF